MPNRAMSYRPAPVVIISMAQQARPKVAGNTDALRTQPAACSTVVSRKPLGSFSSIPIFVCPCLKCPAWRPLSPVHSVPFQAPAAPYIGIGDKSGEDEEQHFDEP